MLSYLSVETGWGNGRAYASRKSAAMIDVLAVSTIFLALLAAGLAWAWWRAATREAVSAANLLRARDSENTTRRLIDALSQPIAFVDTERRVRHVNQRFQEWLGLPAETLLGADLAEISSPLTGEPLEAGLARALSGTADAFEVSPALRSSPRSVRVSLVPFGEPCQGVIVAIEDVSERKLAEERLRGSEATTRAILEAAVDGIITIDAQARIETFNRAAERIFGFTAAEVVGKNVNMLMPSPYREAHDQFVGNYLTSGHAKIIGIGREVVGLRRDGTTFPMDLAVGESRVGGRRIFAGIIRDITDRKQADVALRHAKDEAERANLGKSKFLAAASHDLRQPVQALFFFTAALDRKLHNHPARTVLNDLQRSLESLNILLDSLLDISKLDAGVITPKETTFSVASLLERMDSEFAPSAQAKGLQLRVVPSTAVIRSDPALLSRVIQNLVANAVRYTAEGRILLGCRRHGKTLCIEVWDTGIGIPRERLSDIFEEFYQVGNSERDRSQGLGLGLAIVNRLARLLHHRVSVHSDLGRGSVFSIEVPLADQPTVGVRRLPVAASPSASRLVLVIDDEASVLKSLHLILDAWGFDVLAATSEDEAVALLEQHKRLPNAIVADYRLRNGRTGTEAIRHIRDLFHSPIPSIIITGDTAPERLREAEASGLSILHKPVQPPELQMLLKESLAQA